MLTDAYAVFADTRSRLGYIDGFGDGAGAWNVAASFACYLDP